MTSATYPDTASVYELVRLRPGLRDRLTAVGLTEQYYSYRINEAARAVGIPSDRIAALVKEEASSTSGS